MATATRENTAFGVHSVNKIRSYTENIKYPLCKTFNTVHRNIQNARKDSLVHRPQNAEKSLKTSNFTNFLKMVIIHFFLQISKYSKDFEEIAMQSGQWTCLPLQIDESTCHFWGCLGYRKNPKKFEWKFLHANSVDHDQTAQSVASDEGLNCFPKP